MAEMKCELTLGFIWAVGLYTDLDIEIDCLNKSTTIDCVLYVDLCVLQSKAGGVAIAKVHKQIK